MIQIKMSWADGSVSGAELELGQWVVRPEEFADFFDTATLPESFTILGGTVPAVSDWYSDESLVRAEMFIKIGYQYFDKYYSSVLTPVKVEMDGVEFDAGETLPEGTVF